jgi:predicted DNA-binding protein (MmcQ/YjbR family)
MDIEYLRDYCLNKKQTTESTPFNFNTLVFKVCGKMFCICDIDLFESINLKCYPEKAITLREQFAGINPGYHMNKKHWNTVDINKDVPDSLILKMIDESYMLVVKSLPKKVQREFE